MDIIDIYNRELPTIKESISNSKQRISNIDIIKYSLTDFTDNKKKAGTVNGQMRYKGEMRTTSRQAQLPGRTTTLLWQSFHISRFIMLQAKRTPSCFRSLT